VKVCVYAICKNERQFVLRWFKSACEADYVCVLDTGSTDGTYEALLAPDHPGARIAQKIISPWRFDTARNESMKLIPDDADVCVCIDLDEFFTPGWCSALKASWNPGATTGRYEYVWNFNPDGSDGYKFLGEKIHARAAVSGWEHPVHETLVYTAPRVDCELPIRLEHHADPAKSRSQYLPLLEQAVREDPSNDRNLHYLGREYMFHGDYTTAIDTFQRHLECPNARWLAERAASWRFMGRCRKELGDMRGAESCYLRAADEAPEYREALVELAMLYYEQKRWVSLRWTCLRALDIRERRLDYLSEPESWGARLYDLLSIADWQLGYKLSARHNAERAHGLDPADKRIANNLKLMSEGMDG
jgi:glycosyltransferase involved in cell wall biosynthesis